MEDGFVHALREDAHEDLVVVVEERDGSVIARVAAVLLLVEDADDATAHAFWECAPLRRLSLNTLVRIGAVTADRTL